MDETFTGRSIFVRETKTLTPKNSNSVVMILLCVYSIDQTDTDCERKAD